MELLLGQGQEELGDCHGNGDPEDLRVHVLLLVTQLVPRDVNLRKSLRGRWKAIKSMKSITNTCQEISTPFL